MRISLVKWKPTATPQDKLIFECILAHNNSAVVPFRKDGDFGIRAERCPVWHIYGEDFPPRDVPA